jgi:death-on-curing protein
VKKWIWVELSTVLAIHEEQIAEHGGATGLRDEGLFHSAMARPQHLHAYENPDAADLAAAYGFGLARNHAFVDGDKRTALVMTELFLELNGYELTTHNIACVTEMLGVAEGSIPERDFADWLRRHLKKRR